MRLILIIAALLLLAAPAQARQRAATDTTPPTATLTAPANGATVYGTITVSATASDNVAVNHVTFRVDGGAIASDSTAPYSIQYDTTKVGPGSHTFAVRAVDNAGNVSVQPDSKAVVTVLNGGVQDASHLYTRQPSHLGGPAHTDSYCASNLTLGETEVRPENNTANNTLGSPGAAVWGNEVDPAYWTQWGSDRSKVDGQFKGVTTSQFQWAACKWGMDDDWFRAAGVQETDWHQYFVGDNCGVAGEASYSIIQIKNRYCNGALAWGGYPQTQNSTAFALDFYGAYERACFDGAFYDGGSWLYNGQTVDQIASNKGWDYVAWGCVGSWFSGGWYDSAAVSYINSVKAHLANRDWTLY